VAKLTLAKQNAYSGLITHLSLWPKHQRAKWGSTGHFTNIDYVQSNNYEPNASPKPPCHMWMEPLMKQLHHWSHWSHGTSMEVTQNGHLPCHGNLQNVHHPWNTWLWNTTQRNYWDSEGQYDLMPTSVGQMPHQIRWTSWLMDRPVISWSPQNQIVLEVHLKRSPDDLSEPGETRLPLGFVCTDPDEMSWDDHTLHALHQQRIRRNQSQSNHLTELARGGRDTHSTCFEDIVPKPYQEFKTFYPKNPFDKLPDLKNGTMS